MSETFLYTIYIDAPVDRIWTALTSGEFTRQYWAGRRIESSWEKGAPLRFCIEDGDEAEVFGEVLECDPPKRLSYTWARKAEPGLAPSKVTFDLDQVGESIKLTLTHEPLSASNNAREGWPAVLSSLKSFLEAGRPLAATALYRKPCAA
ncbi:SRPBCC family protein [Terrarubrum flagellatum]|uniref:SRPBCC family protein n=1 Tax=Terrirubrum flagellatum TaxID=2895980 RepID=UPI003144F535